MKRVVSLILTITIILSMLPILPATAESNILVDGIGFDYADEFYPSIKSGNDLYHMSRPFDKFPHTFEAWIAFPTNTSEPSVLMGNGTDQSTSAFDIEVNKSGNPLIRTYNDVGLPIIVTFDNVNLYTGQWLHLTITLNPDTHILSCYVDGELAQSEYFYPDFNSQMANKPYAIGGNIDYQNNPHFKGRIKYLAFYSDARTENEIKADMTSVDTSDADYIAAFDMSADKAQKNIDDISANGWRLEYSDLWVEEQEVQAWRDTADFERAYSMAVIGDIQYSSEFYSETLAPMYQWIVDNADEKNTVYSIGLGDITNRDTIFEWENARNAMAIMDGKVPYSVVRGNHDLKNYSASANNDYDATNLGKNPSQKGHAFDQYFATDTESTTDYVDQFINNGENGGVMEEGSVMNTWRILEVAKTKWLLLNLDYAPSDTVLAWASSVVEAHKDCKVIVSTHSYIGRDGSYNREGAYVGEKGISGVKVPADDRSYNLGVNIWEKFVSQHENIQMVLCGHISSTVNPVVQRKGVHGNTVTEILIDGQSIDNRYDGLGFVAMFYFNEDGTKLDIEYYSATVGKYYRTANLRRIDLSAEGSEYDADKWLGLAIKPEGEGTIDNPYLVSNAGNLLWISNKTTASTSASFEGTYFLQTNDIDLCGRSIKSIGEYYVDDNDMSAFGGIYNGNGFSIKNGYIIPHSYSNDFTKKFGYGLFGTIYGATISNITLDNIEIIGNGITGSIVGKAAGAQTIDSTSGYNTITNCNVNENCNIITFLPQEISLPTDNTLDDDTRAGIIGGIVGLARSTTVKYCQTKADITASGIFGAIGGIAGSAGYNSVIDHCINDGSISVVDNSSLKNVIVGGVVGMTSPTIVTNDTLGDNKHGTLHITNSVNNGELKYTGSEPLSVPSGWGGVLGATGRLPDLDNGKYTSETKATITDTPSFMINNCYNSVALNSNTGDTTKAATAGIVGRGAATSGENASTLWLANSASVYVTRTKGGVNGGSTYNGYNTYNYYNKDTAYSLKVIAVALDENGQPTVEYDIRDNSNDANVLQAISTLTQEITKDKQLLTGEIRHEFDETTGTLTISGVGNIPDYEIGAQPWSELADSVTSLVITDSITSIGANAFNGFANLTSISIPGHISKIGSGAFEGTAYFSNDANWTGDVLYIGNVIAKIKQSADKNYSIKYSVTGIMDNAFDGIEIKTLSYPLSKEKWFSLYFGSGNDAVSSDLGQFIFGKEAVNWLFDKTTGTVTIFGQGNMPDYDHGSLTPWYIYKDELKAVIIEEGITSVAHRAFGSNQFPNISSVTIPEGVTLIGTAAFEGCSITEIEIPSTVTTMKNYVFYGNDFTSVVIPESLTSLGTYVFTNCKNLTDVYIPITLTSIGSNCFNGCTALQTVHYPGSYSDFAAITVAANNSPFLNATIDCEIKTEWSFDEQTGVLTVSGDGPMTDYTVGGAPWYVHADKIVSVTVTDTVTSIGDNAFNGLTKLETLNIPETITNIGINAFDSTAYAANQANWVNDGLYVNNVLVKLNKSANEQYTVTANITGIADNVFADKTVDVLNYPGTKAQWLAIAFNEGNTAVSSDLGQFMFGGATINWHYDEDTGTITIKGTGNMPNYALGTAPWTQYRLVAKRIVIESGITKVGNHAFNGAKIDNVIGYANVTEIVLPEGLTTIGGSAFQYVAAPRIDLPSTVNSFGTYTFAYSSTVETISLSTKMTTIPGSMFRGSSTSPAIKKIYIPANVTSVTASAFLNRKNVEAVYYAGTEAQWAGITFNTGNTPLSGATKIIYNHVHSYTVVHDNDHHWKECECGDICEYSAHTFDNSSDIECNGCTFTYGAPIFTTAYTDPHGLISASKAVILTNETILSDAQDGAPVILSWCGKDYLFYKNVNAFTSLADIESKEFDNPHILVKNNTEGKNFYLNAPASVFTQNYASDPVKEGTQKDGSDWSFNKGTGEGQFDNSSGVDVVYNNLGVGATGTNIVPSGDYKFYGFTITWNFLDYSKNSEVKVTIENSRYLANGWGKANTDTETIEFGNVITNYPFVYLRNKADNDNDSFTLKNVYVTNNTNKYAGNIFTYGESIFEHVTFDKVFFDIPQENRIYGETPYVQSGTNTSFTITNSCFKNYQHYNTKFMGNGTAAIAGQTSKIIISNNIFNESGLRMMYSGLISYVPNNFTEVDISNNNIFFSEGIQFISATGDGTNIPEAPMKLTITDNYVEDYKYIRNDIKSRNYTSDSVVENNFTKNAETGVGVNIYFTGKTNLNSITWLISADGVNTSSTVQQMSFNGDTFDEVEEFYVSSEIEAVNLNDVIKTNGAVTISEKEYNANIIEGYLDSDCTIPADLSAIVVSDTGTKVYVKIKSPDGLTTSQTVYEVNVIKDTAFSVDNTGLGSTLNTTIEGIDYYWVSWRGQVTATGDNALTQPANHRVGAIYFSSIENLENVKDDIIASISSQDDINSIDDALIGINEKYAQSGNIKAYAMNKNKALLWDAQSQSYGYRYNFNIHEDYYRGVVMYVIYEKEPGQLEIQFSEMVVQQSGANVA